jgi:hypothetical protein
MSIFADDLHQSLQRAAKLTEEPSLRPRQSGRSWLVRESRPQRSCRALIACIENGGIAVGGRGDGRSVLSRRQRLRRLLLMRLLLPLLLLLFFSLAHRIAHLFRFFFFPFTRWQRRIRLQ